MIVVVGGIKGGSGKTTVATHLAMLCPGDVLLVDADEQETASDFTVIRNETVGAGYTCIKLTGSSVRTEIQKLAPNYDHIIIDTGGRDTTSQRAALTIADVFLVPFLPRSFDVWTVDKVSKIVDEVQAVNPSLKMYAFLNRADPRGMDNQDAGELLSGTFDFINASLGSRKAFANAATCGLSVTELRPRDNKACDEIMTLFRHLFDIKVTS